MQLPEDKNLEEFIGQQLKKLPDQSAPETLISNVMNAIQARKELPWYKQPWSEWPRANQNIFVILMVCLVGGIVWAATPVASHFSFGSLVQKVQSMAWAREMAQHFGSLMLTSLKSMRFEWIIGLAAACVLFYCWCIAAGVALFRVASQRKYSI